MSCKNKIAHFQWMRCLPRHPPHGTAGPNNGRNVCLIDVRLKARVLFPETNNQAAWRALAKWLKHSSKHSNKKVDMKRFPWHAIGNHRTITLNMHLPETPDMSHMSELDKRTLFSESELLANSILELKFCNSF